MSEVNFGPGQTPVTQPAAAPAPAPAAPATNLPATVSNPGVPARSNLLLGDRLPSFEDIIFPRINLVHNIGKLQETFEPGSIILGQQVVLFTPAKGDRRATPPVGITVLGFRDTRFCEKTVGGVRGIIVNTEAEVPSQGGTLDYKEWELKKAAGMKLFQPLADCLVAIERPESVPNDESVFVYTVDGKQYALALWALRGSAYTEAGKKRFFADRRLGCLIRGYPTHGYSLSTRSKSYQNGNATWVPVLQPRAKSTPAFIEFVTEILGSPETVKSASPETAVDAE